MTQRSRLSSLALALLFACSDANLAQAQEPAPSAAPAAAATEDQSLTVAEAEALKFPPLSRPWKGTDYQDAAQILSRIGTADAGRLPRLGSARSGELFAKLTTTAHFASFNDPAVEIKTRVPEALEQLQMLNRFGEIYSSAANRKFGGPTEYLELYGVMTHAARRVFIALDEYVATLDEKDPNAPFRKDGIVKLKDVVGDMVQTVVLTLGNEMLSAEDRGRLVMSVEDVLPEALAKLPEPRRQTVVLRLKFISVNTEPEELRPALKKLVEEVNKAVTGATP